MRFGRFQALAAATCVWVAGCGGGDGQVGELPPATAESQLLAFVTAAGELKTFDPANPATDPVTVDTGVAQLMPILNGTFRASDNSLADPHYPTLLYLKQGKVYRIDLLPGSSQVPVQVSSMANACMIRAVFLDYANPADTRVLVHAQDADPDCNTPSDNSAGYFRISAAATTAPTTVLADVQPRDSVYAFNGALVGVLARSGPSNSPQLVRYNASMQSPQVVTDLHGGTTVDFGGPEPTADLFYFRMRVKDTPFSCLYRYSASSNQLSACLHAYTDTSPIVFTSEADGSHVYYADGNLAFRLPHTGTSPTPIRNASVNVSIRDLRLSANRVILNFVDNGNGTYGAESIPRAGGTVIPLKSGVANALTLSAVTATRVYLAVEASREATIVGDDGSGAAVRANAGWGGFSASTRRISLGSVNVFQDSYHGVLGEADGSNVVTATAFNAQTALITATLGTIANATRSTTRGFGRYRLVEVTVFRPGPNTFDTDVYFADTLTAGSLKALATTSGGNDRIAF